VAEKSRRPDEGGEAPCFAHLLEDSADGIPDAVLLQLAHRLADAVVIADAEGTINFWNESATELFGWSADEAVGRTLDLIIPERLRERHWNGYRRVMQSGHTNYAKRLLEVPALHRDGHTFSIAFTVTLLTHPNELQPFAIAAVLRDDTERWQERRRLREQVSLLEARAQRIRNPL
jgi:PAS domain S-box-containing protein